MDQDVQLTEPQVISKPYKIEDMISKINSVISKEKDKASKSGEREKDDETEKDTSKSSKHARIRTEDPTGIAKARHRYEHLEAKAWNEQARRWRR